LICRSSNSGDSSSRDFEATSQHDLLVVRQLANGSKEPTPAGELEQDRSEIGRLRRLINTCHSDEHLLVPRGNLANAWMANRPGYEKVAEQVSGGRPISTGSCSSSPARGGLL